MTTTTPFGSTEAQAALTLVGGTSLGDNRNDLLKQILVATANRTGGGGGGSGTVTSVGFTGGLVSVATPTTTPALTVAGTSGGIPYFSSASTWATSAALAANALVVGGGAGLAPGTVTTGTGILSALGVNIGSVGAPVLFGGALGTPSSGTLTNCTGLPVAGITGILPSTNGGTGVNNAGTFTNASNTTITGGGTIALGGFTLTVPATGTAALRAANTFTGVQTLPAGSEAAPSINFGSSGTGIFARAANRLTFTFSGTNGIEIQAGISQHSAGWQLGWASGITGVTTDLTLTRAEAGVLGITTGVLLGGDAYLLRKAAATLQLGKDAAGVTNQMLTAASRITSDGVGANLTIAAGNGRGGAGGTLILSTYTTAGAGVIGTLTSRMTIDTAGAIAFPNVTAVVTETVTSDRTLAVSINGTAYKICLKA